MVLLLGLLTASYPVPQELCLSGYAREVSEQEITDATHCPGGASFMLGQSILGCCLLWAAACSAQGSWLSQALWVVVPLGSAWLLLPLWWVESR